MSRKMICLLMLPALGVCAQDRQAPPPQEVQPAPRQAAPADPPVAVDSKTFVIGSDDVISIKVWREPELSTAVRVRPDGKITLPLGGEVEASGKTPEQLAKEIAKALASYVNSPLVIVSVLEVRSKKYSITGEVGRAGAYPLTAPTTILDAVIQAGLREYAKKKKITLLRDGKLHKFNYEEVVKGKKVDQNILLEHGDLIAVP